MIKYTRIRIVIYLLLEKNIFSMLFKSIWKTKQPSSKHQYRQPVLLMMLMLTVFFLYIWNTVFAVMGIKPQRWSMIYSTHVKAVC